MNVSVAILILFLKLFFDYFYRLFHTEINSVEFDIKCANLSCLNSSIACTNLLVRPKVVPRIIDASDCIFSNFSFGFNPEGKDSFPSVILRSTLSLFPIFLRSNLSKEMLFPALDHEVTLGMFMLRTTFDFGLGKIDLFDRFDVFLFIADHNINMNKIHSNILKTHHLTSENQYLRKSLY